MVITKRCKVILGFIFLGIMGYLFSNNISAGEQEMTGEFRRDEHTLFLAHYNISVDADYAKGNSKALAPAGSVKLTSNGGGRFGEALMAISEPQVTLIPFQGVSYETKGNIDPDEGTIEMWVNLNFNLADVTEETRFQLFDCRRLYKDTVQLFISEDNTMVFFVMREGRGSWDTNACFAPIDWRKGEWHHVAAVWSKKEGKKRLYLDGKFMTEKPFDGFFLPLPEKMFIGALSIGQGNFVANAIIDEVRISNIARYKKEDFELQEKKLKK